MILFIAEYYSIIWKNAIHFSIHLWMNIWVVSSLWLSEIQLLWAFVFRSMYGHMLSFLLGKCLRLEWLDHVVGVCLVFKKLPKCFPNYVYHFTFSPAVYVNSVCFTSFTKLGKIFLNISHSRYVVLIYHYRFNLHFPPV